MRLAARIFVIGVVLSSRALAQVPDLPPQELVRRAVSNELEQTTDGIHYMYQVRRERPSGSTTKQLVETKDGVVARLIAINDKPLTPEQRAWDDGKLKQLLSDPRTQSKRQKEQREDAARVMRLIRELPNAFRYEYAGTTPGPNGTQLVRLNFKPDPSYNPPSKETAVFEGMAGSMLIDPVAERLVRIEAELFRDVNFGWGILGKLNRGGTFQIQQSHVGGRWMITEMRLKLTGKVMLFKNLNIHQVDRLSDFSRVPPGLTLAQGVEMLRNSDSVVAGTAQTAKRR